MKADKHVMIYKKEFSALSPTILLLCANFVVAQSDSVTNNQQTALEASIGLSQEISRVEQQIEDLESEFGPLDFRLLEPLTTLSELIQQAGNSVAYERVLSRRQQLLRVEEGPVVLSQIPIIAEQIRMDFQRGDWESVVERFESIHFIHTQHPEIDTEIWLNSLSDIRAVHLLAVYLDIPEERSDHIVQVGHIQRRMLGLMDDRYGGDSERIIPWLYGIAAESYRVTNYMQSLGVASSVANNYLGHTLEMLERIQSIVNASNDPEAKAMAMIYLADFQLLRREVAGSSIGGRVQVSSRGIADQTYRRAMEMLAEAGVEQSKIDQFFAHPMPLPVSDIYLSIDAALDQRNENGHSPATEIGDLRRANQGFHIGHFSWTASLPKTQFSATPDLLNDIDTARESVQFRFTVDSIGRAKSVRLDKSEGIESLVRSEAQKAVEVLQFRPAFIDRRWRRVRNISMLVNLPPALP